MNRFGEIDGDLSTQLAPWECRRIGRPVTALFRLEREIQFRSDIAGAVTVPVGYLSDLASIPQFAWSIFMASDDPRIELGGWVHDVLYEKKGKVNGLSLTRQQCDHILAYEAMKELGATEFQQHAVYYALRWFGDRW